MRLTIGAGVYVLLPLFFVVISTSVSDGKRDKRTIDFFLKNVADTFGYDVYKRPPIPLQAATRPPPRAPAPPPAPAAPPAPPARPAPPAPPASPAPPAPPARPPGVPRMSPPAASPAPAAPTAKTSPAPAAPTAPPLLTENVRRSFSINFRWNKGLQPVAASAAPASPAPSAPPASAAPPPSPPPPSPPATSPPPPPSPPPPAPTTASPPSTQPPLPGQGRKKNSPNSKENRQTDPEEVSDEEDYDIPRRRPIKYELEEDEEEEESRYTSGNYFQKFKNPDWYEEYHHPKHNSKEDDNYSETKNKFWNDYNYHPYQYHGKHSEPIKRRSSGNDYFYNPEPYQSIKDNKQAKQQKKQSKLKGSKNSKYISPKKEVEVFYKPAASSDSAVPFNLRQSVPSLHEEQEGQATALWPPPFEYAGSEKKVKKVSSDEIEKEYGGYKYVPETYDAGISDEEAELLREFPDDSPKTESYKYIPFDVEEEKLSKNAKVKNNESGTKFATITIRKNSKKL